jgi:hypothetical protein
MLRGDRDAYVVRFNAALSQRLQATYVGGSTEQDTAHVLKVHPRSGDVYVGGETRSSDIAGTAGGYLPGKPSPGIDFYLVRISADLAAVPALCSAFGDVPGNNPFCPNVDWLKNREVTLGCSAGLYCPASDVTRSAMAAFMNRLGTALTPVMLKVEAQPGAIALGAGTVVCQTGDHDIGKFSKRAYLDAVLMANAAANTDFGADPVVSFDGGATWIDVSSLRSRATAAATQWANLRVVGGIDLWTHESVRFGLRMTHGAGGGSGSLAESRCVLRVIVGNRTVVNAPF